MYFTTLVSQFVLLGLYIGVHSQSPSNSYIESGVPTGIPIPGDYTGALRPQIHYTPPQHFMNGKAYVNAVRRYMLIWTDPNGLFRDVQGTYHLYYQYNPTGNVAGNQHWGHATSIDLLHWTNRPIALFPSNPSEGIFTGCAVIDTNNTSGLFPKQTNGVVAIYTLDTPTSQTQEIAYSTDNGYTFTKYVNNPVLSANSTNFRDPKVFWHTATSSWVMVVSFATDFVIAIYTSPNLITWTHASNITQPGLASLGSVSECPNLVPIPTLINASLPFSPSNTAPEPTYLLLVSLNPGAPLGGSITSYFPGLFNGTHFSPLTPGTARLTDFAKDNYAAQFFDPQTQPAGSAPVSLSWVSNWQYADSTPIDTSAAQSTFRSLFSLPRTHVLANLSAAGYDLLTLPPDLSALYTSPAPLAASAALANSSLYVPYGALVASRALTFTLAATNVPLNTSVASGSLNFTVSAAATGEALSGGFFFGGANPGTFFLSRANTRGFYSPFFTRDFSVASPVTGVGTGSWSVQVVVDRSVVEVYLDGGSRVGTMVYFVEGELDTLVVGSAGVNEGIGVQAEVWGLEGVWAGADGNGTGSVEQVVGRNGWVGGGELL